MDDAVPLELGAVAFDLLRFRIRRLPIGQRQRRPVDQDPVRILIRKHSEVDQSVQLQLAAHHGAADGLHSVDASARGRYGNREAVPLRPAGRIPGIGQAQLHGTTPDRAEAEAQEDAGGVRTALLLLNNPKLIIKLTELRNCGRKKTDFVVLPEEERSGRAGGRGALPEQRLTPADALSRVDPAALGYESSALEIAASFVPQPQGGLNAQDPHSVVGLGRYRQQADRVIHHDADAAVALQRNGPFQPRSVRHETVIILIL